MKREFEFKILKDKEFADFALKHPQHNFFESLYMKELLLKEDREVYLVGVLENKKLVAASILASSFSFMGKKTFEALKGFLVDYQDRELLTYFTCEVKKFINEHNGFRLIIDPYIPHIERNSDAEVVEGGINNESVIETLTSLGFKEVKNSAQVKWTYVLDIKGKSADEVFASFKPNARNYINRTMGKYKLVIEQLSYDELDVFKKITMDTCERRGFKDRTLEYYQNMFNIFKDDVKVLVCKLDCETYLKSLEEEQEQLNFKITNLSDSASNKKKKETMRKDVENINNKIAEVKKLQQEHGKYVILSGAMFVLYGDEIVYLFSGSYDEYMKFCGQYALQWEMIKYAAEHHYQRYNFYGIKDVFDKNGKDYGVYEFKKGFNGYVEELLGAYELGTNSTYKLYKMLKKIKGIIKK